MSYLQGIGQNPSSDKANRPGCSAQDFECGLLPKKCIETSLDIKQEHLTALSNKLQSGLLFEDAARRVVFANQAFCAMFGIAGPNCLIGANGHTAYERVQTLCVEPADFIIEAERMVSEQTPVVGGEMRLMDGRWLERDYAPVIVGGACEGHVWNYRDITGRKRIEIVLRESEQRLSALFNQAPIGIGILDSISGRFEQVNKSYGDIIGYSKSEMLERTFQSITHPDDLETDLANMARLLNGRIDRFHMEKRYLRKDGSVVWVNLTCVPLWLETADRRLHVAMVENITDRKQAEAAQRASEEQLRQALLASNTGLWDWNTETGEVRFSKEWKSQLGYGETELPDTFETWESHLHPDDRVQAVAYAQAYCANPAGGFRQDFRLRHKDGSYRWIDSHASFVTEPDGRRVRLVGAHTDITERKQAEEALCQSYEERVRISRDLHDNILQSLYAIGLGLESMKPVVKSASPVAGVRIEGAVVQLNAAIHDVRSFIVRMTEPAALGRRDFVQALKHLIGSFAATGAGEIVLHVDSGTSGDCSAEQYDHLLAIAKEAISNSLRHAQATHRSVTLRRHRGGLCLEIADDGVGFDPSQQEANGMGLSNMRARAIRVGGRLHIDSNLGEGTRVVFHFTPDPDEVFDGGL